MNPSTHSADLDAIDTRIRALMASKAPLPERLAGLVRIVEEATPSGMFGSILLLEDGKRLRHGAAPSLPDAYNAEVDGLEIGPDVGSCGTAAYQDRTVSVYDIANDGRWAKFRHIALAHGLRACWSTPIHDTRGNLVGTFANYYRVVRDPSPIDMELTARITRAAAAAIEGART